ncbi:MAG: GWxTD domain-containing protein [Candidatus Cloacimonetes bacterium]|nr:GWxTD domain-containing protein [Candidatus Cloacimonadota bacterium]
MKKTFLIVCVVFVSILSALNVVVDFNRFWDEQGNTIMEINYQVPYRELEFKRSEYGFLAELKVDMKLYKEEVEVYQQDFTNNIILTDINKTENSGAYLDKISITLKSSEYVMDITFQDMNNNDSSNWKNALEIIGSDELISDLELSYQVMPDTSNYLAKFHRDGYLYNLRPNHIFDLSWDRQLFAFYQLSNLSRDSEGKSKARESIQIRKKDEIIKQFENHIEDDGDIIFRLLEIELSDLDQGYYQINVEIFDELNNKSASREDSFSLKKEIKYPVRFFADLDDEFRLIKYFLSQSQFGDWDNLNETSKSNYISRFWAGYDPDPNTKENEFVVKIKKRIEHCNQYFGHFQDGWLSDRGRVYIRNGAPDEIRKYDTGLNTKLASKEYEIWKYRSQDNYTYLFIDLQTSGNFRLIYAENDDRETTLPQWSDYLGEDFDESLLQ